MNEHRWKAALAAATVAALVGAVSASARQAGQAFSDPAGDSNGAPDITSVAIADSAGILTIRLTIAGMKPAADSGVKATGALVALDTNGDGKADYSLLLAGQPSGVSWDVTKGFAGKEVPRSSTIGFFSSGDSYTFKLASSDIGGATGFGFYVHSAILGGTGAGSSSDDAPDNGVWQYSLTSIKPVIGQATTSPAAPVAGKALTMTLPVTRSDSGGKVTTGGTASLDLLLDGQVIAHSDQLRNGVASLRTTVPASATGKVLTARISVTFAGHSVTKVNSLRVA
jgi:hypothetical protein